MGIKHVKGMLLFGPPGTGKTLMARQIGKMLNGKEPKVWSLVTFLVNTIYICLSLPFFDHLILIIHVSDGIKFMFLSLFHLNICDPELHVIVCL